MSLLKFIATAQSIRLPSNSSSGSLYRVSQSCVVLSITLFLTLQANQEVFAQEPQLSLWLDPAAIDFADERAVAALLGLPVQSLVIPCFSDGKTLYTSHSSFFVQMERYRGKPDVLTPLLKQAHQKGMKVYALIDCLHWTGPGTVREEDVLERNLNLAERDLNGSCGAPVDGKYASPFHPQVRQALTKMVEEVAERYPELDGLLLQCRLLLHSRLGYSDVARATYIRAKQIDPLDISLATGEEQTKLSIEWANWRLEQVSFLVRELSTAFRSKNRTGKVAAVGYANWYKFGLGVRNTSLEDWLSWTLSGSVEELFLECEWNKPVNKDSYPFCRSMIGTAGKSLPVALIVAPGEDQGETTLKSLRDEGATRFVVRVSREADLPAAAQLVARLASGGLDAVADAPTGARANQETLASEQAGDHPWYTRLVTWFAAASIALLLVLLGSIWKGYVARRVSRAPRGVGRTGSPA